MATQYTIDTVRDMDQTEFDLLAFVLSGKVAGRITSLAMSLAGTQVRLSRHLEESDQASIDKFNDWASSLDDIEAQNAFFDKTGTEPAMNKEDELRAWLGVRHVIVERGYTPGHLSDNFKYILEQTVARNNPSDTELQALADAGGFTLEDVREIYKSKAQRAIDETMEVASHAMRLVNDYEPDEMTTPTGFHEIFLDAIAKSRKSAIQRGNNTEESMANLMILKTLEDAS